MNVDLNVLSPVSECVDAFTEEELAAEAEQFAEMDAAFWRYDELSKLYWSLIEKEYDPTRIKLLNGMVEDLREENK